MKDLDDLLIAFISRSRKLPYLTWKYPSLSFKALQDYYTEPWLTSTEKQLTEIELQLTQNEK